MSKAVRVAVDVGGTFTDLCLIDGDGRIRIEKVPSTQDPIQGVFNSVEKSAVPLGDIRQFSHGTTVATNALITRSYPRAAMITTEGFRDVLEIRRGTKEDLWDVYADVAPPYIERRDRLSVRERIDYAGAVFEALDDDTVRAAARLLRERGISTVAVCLINSFMNPAHERRVRDILQDEVPDLQVSLSAEVLPEIFEHERFSTTVVNAVVAPLVDGYARRLEEGLTQRGYEGDLLLFHSGGGVMTPKSVTRYAARMAGSGVAAGAIASRHIAGLCGFDNAIGLDMGGTSTDISLTVHGQTRTTNEWFIEFGYPICFPTLDVRTIGAGGGSLAWIDEGGALRNGPQSAGAYPGPACYGLGNDQATNTDANVVLGRLGDALLGGEISLDREAAAQAIEPIADRFGLSLLAAAKAIIQIANANMADAVRLVSVRRGHDPRDFVLVAFGGAGPLHGAAVAQELGIPTVIVPPYPGITSALGCLLVDIRHDLAVMLQGKADEVEPRDIGTGFAGLEAEARERLGAEGIAEANMVFHRTIDMRYSGQWRSIGVPVSGDLSSLHEVIAAFHEAHEREHNYRRDEAPVEVYRLSLTAIGVTEPVELAQHEDGGSPASPIGEREVYFDEEEAPVRTPVYRREDLGAGITVRGPAVVEQVDSTVLVPPEVDASVDGWLNLRLNLGGRA